VTNIKILLTGGGTAGHINPAIAIGNYIKEHQPTAQFLFVGTRNGLETSLVPQNGYDIEYIDIRGFERKISLRNLKNLFKIVKSCRAVKRIIKDFAPNVIIGTGGYVSGPVLYMGAKLKIPTIIHESNAHPGLTSKILSKYSTITALAFADTDGNFSKAKRIEVVGNPIRPEILKTDRDAARRELVLDERPLVLAFGGSLGAAAINYAVVDMLTESKEQQTDNKEAMPFQLLFATGKNYYQSIVNQLKLRNIDIENSCDIRVVEYIYDMNVALAAADLVICRSGAATVSELCACGKASILIPSPNVTANHQEYNARAVESVGGGIVILERDLTGGKLMSEVNNMLDERMFENYGESAKKIGITDATEKMYELVKELV